MSINKSKLQKSIQRRANFTQVPNDIWAQPISAKAKIVFVYLLTNSEKWSPGHREIAAATGVRKQSLPGFFKELEDQSLLTIHKATQSGMRDEYEFTDIEDWGVKVEDIVKKEVDFEVNDRLVKPVSRNVPDISCEIDLDDNALAYTEEY